MLALLMIFRCQLRAGIMPLLLRQCCLRLLPLMPDFSLRDIFFITPACYAADYAGYACHAAAADSFYSCCDVFIEHTHMPLPLLLPLTLYARYADALLAMIAACRHAATRRRLPPLLIRYTLPLILLSLFHHPLFHAFRR